MPPPYDPGENIITNSKAKALCNKSPPTSPARIMSVNEYGQVIGYISPASPTASWFNFKPVEKALVLDVPTMMGVPSGSEMSLQGFRPRMRVSCLDELHDLLRTLQASPHEPTY
ncbi:hypothetical protein FRB94_006506 [Tulasnella sp. JGI-2019a]|nr:hypothetical protein FRB94_006506 [Tulasnella sp. JGI-2019a]